MNDTVVKLGPTHYVFYHDGSEFTGGWYIHTPQGGIGPFADEESAVEELNNIVATLKETEKNGD